MWVELVVLKSGLWKRKRWNVFSGSGNGSEHPTIASASEGITILLYCYLAQYAKNVFPSTVCMCKIEGYVLFFLSVPIMERK